MPTSLESLRRHRAAHAEGPEHVRVWFFHAHVYFDHEDPAQEPAARSFMARIGEAFAHTAHVEVHSLIARSVGPHPRGSFEVLFTRELFTDVVSWLMFNRPEALDVLIHPLTRALAPDHTSRALWLGTQRPIDRVMLEQADLRLEAAGRSEEAIIDGSKKH